MMDPSNFLVSAPMAWFTSCVYGNPADEGYEIAFGDSSVDEDYAMRDVPILPANVNGLQRTFGPTESMHTRTHELARAVSVSPLGDKSCRQVVGYNLGQGNNSENAGSNEGFMPQNPRVEIPDRQMLPGGKYRGIVKLLVETASGFPLQGTAVLIRPDVIAVAGHLLDSIEKSHAVQVTAIAGYGSTGGAFVEERQGTCAVMHYVWYRDHTAPHDIGLVHLESPFTEEVTPIPFKQTPDAAGNVTVEVVAFSTDLSRCSVSRSALHYNSANGSESGLNIGIHWADTTSGASGGAILDEDGCLVGLHTGTVSVRRPGQAGTVWANRAVAVDREGNDFGRLLYALECQHRSLSMADTSPAYVPRGSTHPLYEGLEDGRLEKRNGRVYGWYPSPMSRLGSFGKWIERLWAEGGNRMESRAHGSA